jgi:hypothetical protein
MRIRFDKNVVDFIPETESETTNMELLWRKIIDCAGFSKTLAPIGEYIPTKKNQLSFVIEGGSEQASGKTCTYTCTGCNKTVTVKAGNEVPLCCGQLMDCSE